MTRYKYDIIITVPSEPVNVYRLRITTDKDLELINNLNETESVLWIGSMTDIEFPTNFLVELRSTNE